ncbi:MAG: DNA primase [Desulfurococcaceae archaeon]
MPGFIDYIKYPFLMSIDEFVNTYYSHPLLIVIKSSELRAKLLSIIRSIIEDLQIPVEIFNDIEESVSAFYTLLNIAKIVNDKRLVNRIAISYSKSAGSFFEKEDEYTLVLISNKTGLKAEYIALNPPRLPEIVSNNSRGKRGKIDMRFVPCPFAIPLKQYLKIVSSKLIHDQLYSPSNNIIQNGMVYLNRRLFQRILEENIVNYILKRYNELEAINDERLAEIVEELKKIIATSYGNTRSLKEEIKNENAETTTTIKEGCITDIMPDLFPPCIQRILSSLENGGNPSHIERFNLAAFLGNIGAGPDDILEYFKKTADFNEKIARYQIEHILGLRGGRKKYLPYNCANMKSSGICPVQESCKGGKSPLAVYRYNLRSIVRNKRETRSASR